MSRVATLIFLMIVNALAAGCVAAGNGGQALQASNEIEVCHGYSCKYKIPVSNEYKYMWLYYDSEGYLNKYCKGDDEVSTCESPEP